MRMQAMFVAGAASATFACAAPAAAATGTFEIARLPGTTLPEQTIPPLTGPLPAGDGIVYAVGGTDGGRTVRLVAPGAGSRDVAVLAPKPAASLNLLASATRLVALRYAMACNSCKYQDYRTTFEGLLTGPVGGPLTTIAQCDEGQPCAPAFFCFSGRQRFSGALGGDLLAIRDACGATVTVTNLATGAARSLGRANALAVAGPYVAVGEPGSRFGSPMTVVVHDAASGTEVYRAGPPLESVDPTTSFALLPDGTLVYPSAVTGRRTIVVASPSAPAGRVLRDVPISTVVAGAGSGFVLLTSLAAPLELVRLDGGPAPAVRTDIPDLLGAPAFDGRTITWAQRACVTTVVTSWTLTDPRPAQPDLRCPTPLPSRAAVAMTRGNRLGVVLECSASARGGCLATLRLTAIRRGRLPRGVNGAERDYRLGSVRAALDPGTRARVELVVAPGAARWVRRYAPLRLRADVRSERLEAGQRPAGDSGAVVRTVALRAAR